MYLTAGNNSLATVWSFLALGEIDWFVIFNANEYYAASPAATLRYILLLVLALVSSLPFLMPLALFLKYWGSLLAKFGCLVWKLYFSCQISSTWLTECHYKFQISPAETMEAPYLQSSALNFLFLTSAHTDTKQSPIS